MEHSSQQEIAQPSQGELTHGLPEGFPPTREHLHDSDPLASDLQQRLDEIGKQNIAEVNMEGSPLG